MSHEESSNGPTSGIRKIITRFAGIILALTLLGALWSTALTRVSDRSTAVDLLTRAGTDIINPLLTANGSGMGPALYQQVENGAKAHPNQAIALPFLKVQIPGSAIAGKNFTDGSAVIYRHVAEAYYDGGPDGAFILPSQLKPIVSSYTPFVQNTAGFKSPLPNVPIPQLPSVFTQLWYGMGITPTTLTATGHATTLANSGLLWGISAVLALLLVVFSTGWARLSSVAWAAFHSSWHIALLGIIGTVLTHQNIAHTGPYAGVLDLIGNTFMPVFYTAALVGLAGVAVSIIGGRFFKPGEQHHEVQPAPVHAMREAPSMPPAAAYPPPQANYPPPQANYPPPQANYPPSGGYGPEQGYGPTQPQPGSGYGNPQSPYPQQGYGNPQSPYPNEYPPQQQGYPPQQGGYGAPDSR